MRPVFKTDCQLEHIYDRINVQIGRASSAERSVRLDGPASCSNGRGGYDVSGAGTRLRSNTAVMM